jgi:hypothetical protein
MQDIVRQLWVFTVVSFIMFALQVALLEPKQPPRDPFVSRLMSHISYMKSPVMRPHTWPYEDIPHVEMNADLRQLLSETGELVR